MRNFIIMTIALAIVTGASEVSLSRCLQTGTDQFICDELEPNPDTDGIQQSGNNNGVEVRVLKDGNIDTGNLVAIDLGNGPNDVDVFMATIEGLISAITVGTASDEITIDSAKMISTNDTIFLNSGNDNIVIKDSMVLTTIGGITIAVGDGNDTALIMGSMISTGPEISRAFTGGSGMEDLTIIGSIITNTSDDVTVSVGADDDKLFVSHSTITNATDDFPLIGAGGDDEITIGTEAIIPGGIDCDFRDEFEGFDTLIFAMEVPASQIAELTEQIENLPTPEGSITINNIFYEYRNCDVIEADLGIAEPIPTLSQWGAIAMAGLLGIIGFIVFRNRNKSIISSPYIK